MEALWLLVGAILAQRRVPLWEAYRSLTAQHLCYLRKVQIAMVKKKPLPKALVIFKSWEHSDACLPPADRHLRLAVDFLKSRSRGAKAPSDDVLFESFCTAEGVTAKERPKVFLSLLTLRQRLGDQAVQDLRLDAPLPVFRPSPLVAITRCAYAPSCKGDVPPVVRCAKCKFRLWCSATCASKHKAVHDLDCWVNSTEPPLPMDDKDPWVATAERFDPQVADICNWPLSRVLGAGRVPIVHPLHGVIYAPPSMQATNYPIPTQAPTLVEDEEVGPGLDLLAAASVPLVLPRAALTQLCSWLARGQQGAEEAVTRASLESKARAVVSGYCSGGAMKGAFAQFLDRRGHRLSPWLADAFLDRIFRPRLPQGWQIFPPSSSTLVRRHLRPRIGERAKRARVRAPIDVPTSQALAALKRALRTSRVCLLPYQEGGWWVLFRVARYADQDSVSIACFNRPPGAVGHFGLQRFANHCMVCINSRVEKTAKGKQRCGQAGQSGLHMLVTLSRLIGVVPPDCHLVPSSQPLPTRDRPLMRLFLVAALGAPAGSGSEEAERTSTDAASCGPRWLGSAGDRASPASSVGEVTGVAADGATSSTHS